MSFTAFRGMTPFSQLIFSAFVIIISFILFMFLGMLAAIPLFGLESVISMPTVTNLNDPESIRLLKFLQVVQSFGLFIIPPFVLAWMFYGNTDKALFLKDKVSNPSVLLVIVMVLFTLPVINFIGEWNSQMQLPEWLSNVEDWMKDAEERAEDITKAFLKTETTGGLIFNLFMIAVLPAIGEELLFRGVIQRIFTQWTRSYHWGIWISAILFSALHIQFYGFVPRLLLGVLFGYLLVWSGTIWLPIIAHFFNNAFAVVAMFLIDNKMLNPAVEEIGSTSDSYYAAALSFIIVAFLMWLIKKENKGRELKYINT